MTSATQSMGHLATNYVDRLSSRLGIGLEISIHLSGFGNTPERQKGTGSCY